MALFITHSPVAGGAETVLATYLRQRPGQHRVLVLSDGECPRLFAEAGADVTTLPVFRPDDPGRRLTVAEALTTGGRTTAHLPAILAHVRRSGERAVITNSMKAHALAPAIAATGRRVGMRLHDTLDAGSLSPTATTVMRLAGTTAASTAAVSRAAAHAARAAELPRVRWFHNGVELGEPRTAGRTGPLRLLTISQLTPWKGVADALAAVAAARAEGTAVTLDVVGAEIFHDTGYAAQLHTITHRLGLDDAVRWHGRVTEPTAHLRRADALLHLPTAPDPLPTVVLEAQAWSLPVIGRDQGGIAEVVEHGRTGLLTRSADPKAAADLITQLSHPGTLAAMQWEARSRARAQFSAEAYADRFDDWLTAVEAA